MAELNVTPKWVAIQYTGSNSAEIVAKVVDWQHAHVVSEANGTLVFTSDAWGHVTVPTGSYVVYQFNTDGTATNWSPFSFPDLSGFLVVPSG